MKYVFQQLKPEFHQGDRPRRSADQGSQFEISPQFSLRNDRTHFRRIRRSELCGRLWIGRHHPLLRSQTNQEMPKSKIILTKIFENYQNSEKTVYTVQSQLETKTFKNPIPL